MMGNAKYSTIQEIAELAGVSIQTVSRVINGRPDVAPATRQHILEIIEQTGYQPSATARGLASRRTYTLGLVATDFADYWFAKVLTGAERAAHAQGFHFMLGGASPHPAEEPNFLRLLKERLVEGILFVHAGLAAELDHVERLLGSGLPIVMIGYHLAESSLATLDVDNFAGGRTATEYLLQLGHTRIAMLAGPAEWLSARERAAGYEHALRTAGLPVAPELVVQCSWLHNSGFAGMQALLARAAPFTAVFAHNDRLARGAISALHQAGLRVPEDISVIGYDDIPEAEFSDPPLTTIRQPMEEIGEAGTRLLIQMIGRSTPDLGQRLFGTELIERASCAPRLPHAARGTGLTATPFVARG